MPYTPERWEGMASQAYLNGLQERSSDLHAASMAAAHSYGVRPVGRLTPTLGVYHPNVMNGTMNPNLGASAWEWISSPIDTFSDEYITPAIEQAGKYSAQYEAAKQAEYERQLAQERAKTYAIYVAAAVAAGLVVTLAYRKFKGR